MADLLPERCSDPMYRVDISDLASVQKLRESFQSEPGIIFITVSCRGAEPETCDTVYRKGTGHLAGLFPASRIVFCSSTAIYGVADGSSVAENHPLDLNPRTSVLREAELIAVSTGGVAARLSALYGPGRCVLLERLRKEGCSISPDPEKWVNYIHRDDAVSALLLLASHPEAAGRAVNISDGTPLQLSEIYRRLCAMLDLPLPRYDGPSHPSRRGRTNQRVSNSFLLSLGWKPCYPSLMEGIRHIL